MKDKELEKVDKYKLLTAAIAKVWQVRKVIVVLVVIGALGAVSVNFKKCIKQIGVEVNLEVMQKAALLGTAKTLRKVLSLKEEERERPGTRPGLLSCLNILPEPIRNGHNADQKCVLDGPFRKGAWRRVRPDSLIRQFNGNPPEEIDVLRVLDMDNKMIILLLLSWL